MLSKTLSTSQRYAALYQRAGNLAEFCQSLFPLLLSHADDFGRLPGDVFTIKHLILPISPRTLEEFNTALTALHETCLIRRYRANGNDYIEIQKFEEHQIGLNKRTKSKLPEPPENMEIPDNSGIFRESPGKSSPTELNRTEQNRTELKGIPPLIPPQTGGDIALVTHQVATLSGEPQTDSGGILADRYALFCRLYPPERRVGGEKARKAFAKALKGHQNGFFDHMLAALELQKNSHQWAVDGVIPLMTTWLNQERWKQTLKPRRETTLRGAEAIMSATTGFLKKSDDTH